MSSTDAPTPKHFTPNVTSAGERCHGSLPRPQRTLETGKHTHTHPTCTPPRVGQHSCRFRRATHLTQLWNSSILRRLRVKRPGAPNSVVERTHNLARAAGCTPNNPLHQLLGSSGNVPSSRLSMCVKKKKKGQQSDSRHPIRNRPNGGRRGRGDARGGAAC